jgi:hypothetical protein
MTVHGLGTIVGVTVNGVDPPQPPPFPVVVKLRVVDFAKSDGSTAVANVRATTLQ